MKTINIARQFSKVPGPRYEEQGPHSGQEFRETMLRPAFEEALAVGEKVIIELDGAKFGYPTSFLEEAFGGLARQFNVDSVLKVLEFRASEEPSLVEETQRYIQDAFKTSPQRAHEAR